MRSGSGLTFFEFKVYYFILKSYITVTAKDTKEVITSFYPHFFTLINEKQTGENRVMSHIIKSIMLIAVMAGACSLLAADFADYKTADKAAYKAYRAKKYGEAIESYQASLKLAEKPQQKSQAVYMTAVCYYRMKKYDDAIKEFDQLLTMEKASSSQKAYAHWHKGCISYIKRKYDDALGDFEKILGVEKVSNGHKAQAYTYIGRCLSAQKKYAEAVESYKKVLDLKVHINTINQARLYIAGVLRAEKKPEEALKVYQEILDSPKAHPNHKAQAFNGTGYIIYCQKKYDEAVKEYEKTLALEKVRVAYKAQADVMIGRCYLEQKDYAKAKLALESAQKYIKNPKNYWNKQAVKYLKQCK